MSDRPVDLDALFDRDADSRLLDRRRHDELGLPPLAAPPSSTPTSFGAESMIEADLDAYQRPAVLRVTLSGRPEIDLIPGAVVTVVVEVHAEGDAPVEDAVARIIPPADAEPVAGSFARDDVAADGALLLGEGIALGTIEAHGIVRLRGAWRVLPGTGPLTIDAFVGAPGVPTIAPAALRLPRRSGHAAYEASRPFFEMEHDEVDDSLGSPAAPLRPVHRIDTVLDAPALPPPPQPAAVIPPPPEPKPVPVPEVAATIAPPPPVVAAPVISAPVIPPPVVQPVAAAPVPAPPPAPEPEPAAPEPPEYGLHRALEAGEVRALERLFVGAMPHGLANLTLLCSIAASDGPIGEALGLDRFTRAVAGALPRALVAARMGRPVTSVVEPAALALIRADGAAPPSAAGSEQPMLVLRLDGRELDALRAMLARTIDDPFLRGAQILIGIAPRALDGIAPAYGLPVREALERYRAAASSWLVRATVRRKMDRRFDPVTADDVPLFAAGQVLAGVLREALG